VIKKHCSVFAAIVVRQQPSKFGRALYPHRIK